jgi:hypothetical protein
MLIKRSSLNNESAHISRRSAIAGVAAGLTGALLNAPLKGQASAQHTINASIFVVLAQSKTKLSYAYMDGKPKNKINGYVFACPQNCAKDQPGYSTAAMNPALKSIYLNTIEWIREIIFTDDYENEVNPDKLLQNFNAYRALVPASRLNDDAKAGGCGHISRSVQVTKANLVSGALKYTPISAGVYSTLAIGTVQGNKYLADTIYIYQGDWQQANGSPITQAISEIHSGARPVGTSHC